LYNLTASNSLSSSVIYIFLRWSPHFASFYTEQFLFDTSSIAQTTSFSILHLLPIDIYSPYSFEQIVNNYQNDIISTSTNVTFSDDVRNL